MLTLSAADDNLESFSENTGDGSLTGKVGTALYVSPEMMTGASKIVYTQVSICGRRGELPCMSAHKCRQGPVK